MKQWLSGSFTYSFLCRLAAPFKAPCRKIADVAVMLNKGSILEKLYKAILRFLGKETNIEKSLFFKVMSSLGRVLRKMASSLNGFIKGQLESSLFWRIINDIEKESNNRPYILAGFICAGAFVSYAASAILRSAAGPRSIAVMAVLFIASVILLLAGDNIKSIIKDSLSYRLLAKAFEKQ